MNVAAIPAELREREQWVVWRLEQRDGKPTKVPYRVDGGGRASTTDRDSWDTFENAISALNDNFAGVGFVFSAYDDLVGIDLDHCRRGSGLEPDAAALILAIDSYSEWSQSGDGAHVILRGRLPGPRRRKDTVELYEHGRYFAVTGEHIRGTPTRIEERQAELELIYGMIFPPEADRAVTASFEPLDLDDEQLLERIRASVQGPKFEELWSGRWENLYGSQSEADLALASMLAFWTQADTGRMDALFRRSALMRSKWDARRGESSYGEQTIARALEGVSEVYRPASSRAATTSSPTSSPPRPQVTSSLVPTPLGGDEDVHLVPDLVPPSSWRALDIVALGAQPTPPPEVAGLFYVGKNHLVSGEPEAGKSWLAQAAVAAELNEGHGALWVDADDVGAGDLLERLRSLGVADAVIGRLFAYVLPDEPLTEDALPHLLAAIEQREARLAVFDGFNPLLALQGLDPNSGVDVERLYQLLDPVRKAGCATVWTDNVVKSKEARGAWAIGSERKKSKAEVQLGMRSLEPFGRGRTGKARLEVFKDRPGHLRAAPPGIFVLTSDGERCSWRLEADRSRDEEGAFRPTGLMERVSRYLELHAEPQSLNAIEADVTGRAKYVRVAVERLVAEGYALESEGPRGARLVQTVRAFREDDESEGA